MSCTCAEGLRGRGGGEKKGRREEVYKTMPVLSHLQVPLNSNLIITILHSSHIEMFNYPFFLLGKISLLAKISYFIIKIIKIYLYIYIYIYLFINIFLIIRWPFLLKKWKKRLENKNRTPQSQQAERCEELEIHMLGKSKGYIRSLRDW